MMTPKERAAVSIQNESETVSSLSMMRTVMQQALKAMKDASPYGLTFKEAIIACEEALDHSGEADEMVGCAYCNNPLFAGTKCNNCGFITLAEQAEQEQNSMFMEGYRIGLAEMREKCATVSEQGTGEAVQKAALELLLNERKRIATAIRAIKFEGDTGFRPVSEMVAEHKQDPKKGAAIEKAKMRKATRAEKVAVPGVYEVPVEQAEQEPVGYFAYDEEHDIWEELTGPNAPGATKLYAAPVRTKDLTDDEINELWLTHGQGQMMYIHEKFARAVIASDREKNRGD